MERRERGRVAVESARVDMVASKKRNHPSAGWGRSIGDSVTRAVAFPSRVEDSRNHVTVNNTKALMDPH